MSLISRASYALRAAARSVPCRNLAIIPTVKVASDTSAMDFPAPSHVSLSSDAAEMARQLADFYSNPDSVIRLSDDEKQALHAEIAKKVKAIPDTPLTEDWASTNLQVPDEIRLGDNPYFEVYKQERSEGKLA